MDYEKEREWDPQDPLAFQTEYADRLEGALKRIFPSITLYLGILYDDTGGASVDTPSDLSDDSRQRFIAIADETYRLLQNEFARGPHRVSYEQKNEPVTGAVLDSSSSPVPPRFGERILLLILRTREERVNIPGDLEEEFKQIAAKHGARYAKLWYYKQVAASAWPMVRKAVGWGLLASVAKWVRGRI